MHRTTPLTYFTRPLPAFALFLYLLPIPAIGQADSARRDDPDQHSAPGKVERFAPHAVYRRISPQAEALLGNGEIPPSPKRSQWRGFGITGSKPIPLRERGS